VVSDHGLGFSSNVFFNDIPRTLSTLSTKFKTESSDAPLYQRVVYTRAHILNIFEFSYSKHVHNPWTDPTRSTWGTIILKMSHPLPEAVCVRANLRWYVLPQHRIQTNSENGPIHFQAPHSHPILGTSRSSIRSISLSPQYPALAIGTTVPISASNSTPSSASLQF
jgi:hypothetical protein